MRIFPKDEPIAKMVLLAVLAVGVGGPLAYLAWIAIRLGVAVIGQ